MTSTTPGPLSESPGNDPALEAAAEAGEQQPAHPVSFWRQPWVQNTVPWMTSLSIHAGLIIVALILLATGVWQELTQRIVGQQVQVPTAQLAETDIGAVPHVGAMDDVTAPHAQLDPVESSRDPLPEGAASELDALADAGGSPLAAQSITGITGTGSLAEALGGGGGDGSPLFGQAGGASGAFMGIPLSRGDGGEAYRIVFVCDATGSMEGLRKVLLINELKKAIDGLNPAQQFNALFFQFDRYEAPFDGLRPATNRFKSQSYAFFDRLVIRGYTNPLPSLEAAFRMEPDLIFFLTDGEFDNVASYDDVLGSLRRMNRGRNVTINTIQFMERHERAEAVLRTIAEESGGVYRHVGERDL